MKTLNVDPKVSSTKVPEKIIALSPIKLNAKIIVFSDGGKIEKICKEKNIRHILTAHHSDDQIETISVAKPGFINIKFKPPQN